MPLEKGASEAVVQHNIREMRAAGHPERVAVAAAEHNADKYRGDGMDLDPEMLATVADAVRGLCERVDARERRDEHIGWDAMVKKLEGEGRSHESAVKIAGKIAAEKGEN